jgi:hypothetical protein
VSLVDGTGGTAVADVTSRRRTLIWSWRSPTTVHEILGAAAPPAADPGPHWRSVDQPMMGPFKTGPIDDGYHRSLPEDPEWARIGDLLTAGPDARFPRWRPRDDWAWKKA